MAGESAGRCLSSVSSRFLFIALANAGTIACGANPTPSTPSFASYDGPPAFPSERVSFRGTGGDVVYVAEQADTIGVLDVASEEWLGSAPVGRNPVETDGPHDLVIARDARVVYVALAYPAPTDSSTSGHTHGNSTKAGYIQKLDANDLSILGEMRVDADPGDLLLSEDGERLVVTHHNLARAAKDTANYDDRRSNVSIIRTSAIVTADAPEPVRLPTCAAPHGIATSSATGLLYVSCQAEDALAVVDGDALMVRRIPLQNQGTVIGMPVFEPYEVSASPSGNLLALSNVGAQRGVWLFDVTTETFRSATIAVDGTPGRALWYDDDTLLVPVRSVDGLLQANADGTRLDFRDLSEQGCSPVDLAFSGDRRSVYVLCGDLGTGSAILTLDLNAGAPGAVRSSRSVAAAERIAVLSP